VRFDGSGGIPGPWSAGGVELIGDGTGTNPVLVGLFPSSGSAQYLCWSDQSGGVSRIWLHRFESDGTASAGWPGGGLLVASASSLNRPTALADGLGGAVVAWMDAGMPRGVRVLASGAIALGWGTGVPLLDAGAAIAGSPFLANGSDGSVIVCWTDTRQAGQSLVRARWILPDGTPDPGVDESGVIITPLTVNASAKGAVGDGTGGVYVGWEDLAQPFVWWYVMMSHIPHPTPTGVSPSGHPMALALSPPWPNPARETLSVRLSLPTDAPARIELLDLAGRRLRARDVQGAGDRLERFDGLGDLAPSVYVVRVTQGGVVRAARVALIH